MAGGSDVRQRSPRRSKLVARGGTWEVIAAANASGADIVHIELESGFAPEHRPTAVDVTRRALTKLDWTGKEAWVRFPHVDSAETMSSLAHILGGRPHLVYCAKVKTAEDVQKLDRAVSRYEQEIGIPLGSTQVGAVIERVESLDNVKAIAFASPRMGAIMFGANDMSLDFGYRRTGATDLAYETLYIRSKMVLAGRLARIDIIDAAFMNYSDLVSSEVDADFSARMGFTGKTAISAAQIEGIHRAFIPTEKELIWAHKVLEAAKCPGETQRLVDDDVIDNFDIARAETLVARAG
jgi:citrate lyase subunit beta / citryl-CoA lyase